MFTLICMGIALTLALFSIPQYRPVAIIVALEFAAHKVAFLFGFTELRQEDDFRWVLYAMYSAINLAAMYAVSRNRCHWAIMACLFLNLLINLRTLYLAAHMMESKINYDKFIDLYLVYPWLVGTIMIIEILYIGWLTGYVRLHYGNRNKRDIDYIDRLFYVGRNRFSVGSVV